MAECLVDPSPPPFHEGSRRKLYSMPPSRCCCSSVKRTWKSALKSPPKDEAQGKRQPIRRLYACSFASGAREIAHKVTSWWARCTTDPSKPSAIAEQEGQPAV